MQKLYIARNKNGKYYTKITNKYAGCTKLVSVTLPKDVQLNADFGTYTCEYYLSCYNTKDGRTEINIMVNKIWQDDYKTDNPDVNPYQAYKESDLPF